MGKTIIVFACSLDGYIEGPNGEYDWIIFDKGEQAEVAKFFRSVITCFDHSFSTIIFFYHYDIENIGCT